jgi:hypothetical protein
MLLMNSYERPKWPQTAFRSSFKGAATDLSPDPLRMGRSGAPLGRVACPYAAEPETSNLQRLPIYGVSSHMASRNFRAHPAGPKRPARYHLTGAVARGLFGLPFPLVLGVAQGGFCYNNRACGWTGAWWDPAGEESARAFNIG